MEAFYSVLDFVGALFRGGEHGSWASSATAIVRSLPFSKHGYNLRVCNAGRSSAAPPKIKCNAVSGG